MTDPATEPTAVEERLARHLAAKDWQTTDGSWDAATPAFRAAYLDDAREVLAIVRAAVPPAADPMTAASNSAWVDGDELMETMAAALWAHCFTSGTVVADDPRNIAAVAAAVSRAMQPAPVDQAAEIERMRERHKASLRRADEINNELMEEVQRYAAGTERPVLWSVYNRMHQRALNAETEADRLRRMADEEQQPETQAQPPRHRWSVETRDAVADQWAPGTPITDRDKAVERYEHVTKNWPTWKDGTPVQRRLVRATTTYTVEAETAPAVAPQPGKEA